MLISILETLLRYRQEEEEDEQTLFEGQPNEVDSFLGGFKERERTISKKIR